MDLTDLTLEQQIEFARLQEFMDSPEGRFSRLPLAEQKQVTYEHAINAAASYLRARDWTADPMHHFWDGPNHDRDLPTYALLIAEHALQIAVVLPAPFDLGMPKDALADLLSTAWTMPEWPVGGDPYTAELWVRAFRAVGFVTTDDDHPAPPAEPITLWRGAVPAHKRGLSWTADRQRAEWFRDRFPPSEDGGPFKQARLYEVKVNPNRILARFTERGEDEWVIDPRRLTIRTIT